MNPGLLLALVAASVVRAPAPQDRDPDLARRLYLSALDLQAEFEYDSARVLMRQALAADPTDLAAHDQFIWLTREFLPDGVAEIRRAYDSMPDSPQVECLRARLAVAHDDEASAAPALFALQERYPEEACPVVALARIIRLLRPEHEWKSRELEYLERAVELAPSLPYDRMAYAAALAESGRFDEADRAYSAGAVDLLHPMQSGPLLMRRAALLARRGDPEGSEALRRAVEEAVERDGRPGVRFMYLRELSAFTTVTATTLGSMDALLRAQAELARHHEAGNWEWQVRYTLGTRLTNRGETVDAIEELDRAVEVADRTGVPHQLARALYKRAAALTRAGRRAEAELDLLRAVELIPLVGSPYSEAETWHGLLHLYDEDGRLDEALEASARFIASTERMPHSPLRMSAWLDAGALRWKAGQHAAAEEAYRGLVGVVDDFDEYHAYAGRHFERIGDLHAAREYYRRGVRSEAASAEEIRHLSWAGLARVHAGLGDLDSAEVAARRHDALLSGQTSVPMLPRLLFERGELDEAIATVSSWARRRLAAGNVRGAATAHLLWAELLLGADRAPEALSVATRADSLAVSVDRVGMSAEANRIRGLALEAMSRPDEGLRALASAAELALRHGDASGVIDSHVALGRLSARAGRTEDALAAQEVAAEQVEKMTAQLDIDYDRVRFRERRMAPFDAALRALAADGPSADPAELLAWSSRRKAAALRLVRTGVSGNELPVTPPGPRLDRYEVLLDYSVLPDAVLLLVGRRPGPGEQEDADLDLNALWLEISPDSLRSLVEELRRPFDAVYGGRLDLARAPYSQPAARALYEAILAPAEEFVGDARRLLVSPDGALHRVSFAGLVAPAMAGRTAGDYLVDRYEIVYLTAGGFGSGSHAAGDEAVAMDGQLSVLFGDAPGTRAELETLARLWPGQVFGGESGAGAESSVHEMSAPPAVLHVAAHAIADDRDPFASHILLLADSLEDGLLHGKEIEQLDLTGSLVVLSACETVEGPLFEGEGLLGLRRSFQAAGASQVLATLWPVGPSAADLSRYFYEGIVRGHTPSQALREAQLRIRSDPATAHPFHWAGFVLFGGG